MKLIAVSERNMKAQEEFWNWFIRHEAELFDFEPDIFANRERIFDQVAAELQKIDPNFSFEFGPKATRREFVISASGIKSAFPAVVSLVDAAPPLHRWRVIAFRPRRTPLNTVEYGGRRVDPKDVQFSLLGNGTIAGIHLFIPAFREDDAAFKVIGYLLLDEALGEFDVESRLGLIEILSPNAHTVGNRHPLSELPARFDELLCRLERHSGMPS